MTTIHTIIVGDNLNDHVITGDPCPCEPKIIEAEDETTGDTGWIVIHNPLGGVAPDYPPEDL